MDRRRFVVTSASVGAVVAAVAAGCSGKLGSGGGSGPIDALLDAGVGAGTKRITVQYATTTIQGKKFRGRTYDGIIPGPTIVTRPGSSVDVDIVNRLPPNPAATCPKGPMMVPDIRTEEETMMGRPKRFRKAEGPFDCMNNPHEFNTTNLHTHGIQTTPHLFQPLGTSDPMAPLIGIRPGKHFRYNLPVPPNHPSGLHWYHPHHHGATDVQVSNGMAGIIVVRGPIDEVPEIKAARELFVIVQTLNVNKSKTDPDTYDLEYEAYKSPKDGGYFVDSDYTMFTVATEVGSTRTNAQGVKWVVNDPDHESYTSYPPPVFNMQPGEVVRLRFLNGANQNTLPLILPGFEVWQIGFDGVNLPKPTLKDMSGDVPGGLKPKNFIAAPVRMTVPGNRIEFLIKAPDKPGTYMFSSLKADELHGPGENIDFIQFVVSGAKKDMAIPTTLPATPREEPPIPSTVPKRTFTLSFNASEVKVLTGFEFLIDNTLYDEMSVPTNVHLNDEEEWTIKNTTGAIHPFHIHVNSFQLVAINGVEKPGEIWDTFYVPPKSSTDLGYGSITIRLRFREFTGKSVFHCHFLSHEDTGMMQNFTVH
ncbi:MAG TPA: multicopper oxidase domain-containing protein [Candidatus Acidoferrales bacterium]|nr:multicopper oxidase domain-containing protein [Candidatus Acidoferrales bacterium]